MTPTAATIVPTNIEKLPLYHWRPGARLLAVGSRDGADFAGDPLADRNTFQRPVTAALLTEAIAKQRLDGVAATWSASLADAVRIEALQAVRPAALVIASPGVGDAALLERLLPVVDAWVLLVTGTERQLDRRILEQGRHVEVLLGLDAAVQVPELPWSRAAAVHLCAVRPAEADALDSWCEPVRERLLSQVAVYDHHHPHTDCRGCGERLVWRHSGRSRIDAPVQAGLVVCGVCARPSGVRVS
jgi:hypothetical protein